MDYKTFIKKDIQYFKECFDKAKTKQRCTIDEFVAFLNVDSMTFISSMNNFDDNIRNYLIQCMDYIFQQEAFQKQTPLRNAIMRYLDNECEKKLLTNEDERNASHIYKNIIKTWSKKL